MDLHPVDAVLFDMDGTLVDSDAAVDRGWLRWAAEYGVDRQTAERGVIHGSPSDHTIRRLRPDLDGAAFEEAVSRQLTLQYADVDDVVPITGAHELLATLDRLGIPWAVVTSADTRLARARLGAAGITPPLLVSVDDIRAGKPDPEGYLLAASRLGVDPTRCLVVEDAVPGVQAGRAAGATVAALKGVDADLRITDLTDLTALIVRRAGVAAAQ
jgi:mannitol-1-/sugar-/sorbitol-6-phosphatase